MLELKLNHVSKRDHCYQERLAKPPFDISGRTWCCELIAISKDDFGWQDSRQPIRSHIRNNRQLSVIIKAKLISYTRTWSFIFMSVGQIRIFSTFRGPMTLETIRLNLGLNWIIAKSRMRITSISVDIICRHNDDKIKILSTEKGQT